MRFFIYVWIKKKFAVGKSAEGEGGVQVQPPPPHPAFSRCFVPRESLNRMEKKIRMRKPSLQKYDAVALCF